jgi:hypothetical protein
MGPPVTGTARLLFVALVVALIGLPARASAGVAWSSPVVVAHGAQLDTVAASGSGALALVYTLPAGPGDFSGAPSGSAGLDLVLAASDGSVSPPVELSRSPTARGSVAAVGRNRDAVVAWIDSTTPGAIWVAVRSGSGSVTPAQELAIGAFQY